MEESGHTYGIILLLSQDSTGLYLQFYPRVLHSWDQITDKVIFCSTLDQDIVAEKYLLLHSFHRITEWLGLKGTLKTIQFNPHALGTVTTQ